jgi:hypothetical protein
MPNDALTRVVQEQVGGSATTIITQATTAAGGEHTHLTPSDRDVQVYPPSGGTHTVYLPSVSQASGDYLIETPENAAGTVTVVDYGDCAVAVSLVLTAQYDRVVLRPIGGRYWIPIQDVTT